MSASLALGGPSRCGRVLGPSLDKIIKNAAWRKHSHLVSACKSSLDKLETLSDSDFAPSDAQSPLSGLSYSDAEYVLQPLFLALDSAYSKVVEPALECTFKLISLGLVHGEIDRADSGTTATDSQSKIVFRLIDAVCKSGGLGEEAIELGVLRVLLSAVRSPCILIRADCLIHIVRTCYNVYLGGLNGTNQICAKSVLAQIMIIVFTRVEEDSMDVHVKRASVSQLLEFTDKNLNEGNSILFCQNFINEVMEASEGVPFPNSKAMSLSSPLELQNSSGSVLQAADESGFSSNGEFDNEAGVSVSKIREDGILLFKNLCKLTMKFSSQRHSDDRILLRGKILSLELLKVVMDSTGSIWRVNERFLDAIKQYLCLSLLKNSALSVMAIFQLQCSIFMNLLSKFRSGLKKEIGMFFPMLILQVLENVLQPSFLQKMTVLNLLDKLAQDPQIIIDIFVNYDCDVDASNIFERCLQDCQWPS